jgi:AraC family transcriptional regulator
MTDIQDYGRDLDVHWRGKTSSAAISLSASSAWEVTAQRITSGPDFGLVVPVPPQDSYVVSLQLQDYEDGELWLDGRSTPQTDIGRNNAVAFDLRHQVEALLTDPFDVLHFHLPQTYLSNLAALNGRSVKPDLGIRSGKGFHDPVILHLGQALLPALARPHEANPLFLDHVLQAMAVHLSASFGATIEEAASARGLSPRQLRHATEMMASRLGGQLTIAEVARACGLSPSYFARQFREATGLHPHQWLLRQRVDRAKALMRSTSLSLAHVADAVGFADQSHFTRVFARLEGLTPKAWRSAAR